MNGVYVNFNLILIRMRLLFSFICLFLTEFSNFYISFNSMFAAAQFPIIFLRS